MGLARNFLTYKTEPISTHDTCIQLMASQLKLPTELMSLT